MTTPNLTLPEMASGTSQKHVLFNEAMQRVDAAVQLSVIDTTTTAPPVSPSDGDAYVVAATATGVWTGRETDIAAYFDGQWIFLTPSTGWIAYNQDTDTHIKWNGTAWVIAYSSTANSVGWQNFEHAGSAVTLTTADTWYDLTNDAAGSLTDTSFKIDTHGVIWDDTTDTFDLSDVPVGSLLHFRLDVAVTSGTGHNFEMRLLYGPSYTYETVVGSRYVKTAGTVQLVYDMQFAIFTTATRDNPMKVQIRSDSSGDSALTNGWLVSTRLL
jgi:hypothetical protein